MTHVLSTAAWWGLLTVSALWPPDDSSIPPSLKSETWQVAELPTRSYRKECVADIASSLTL
jgi:hypothetical protein